MEKFVKPCDKESMRFAMVKHEETFREQVSELHRLYQVQKTLMRNMRSSKDTEEYQERWNSLRGESLIQTWDHDDTKHNKPERLFLLQQSAQGAIPKFCGTRFAEETMDETEIELTLGPSGYIKRRKSETTLTSEFRQSFSSISTESSHVNRTCLQTRHWNGPNEEMRLVQVPEDLTSLMDCEF